MPSCWPGSSGPISSRSDKPRDYARQQPDNQTFPGRARGGGVLYRAGGGAPLSGHPGASGAREPRGDRGAAGDDAGYF